MIEILNKINKEIYIAVSGGVDSMAALSFLKNKHKVEVLYFNHGTNFSDKAEIFIENFCNKNKLILHKKKISIDKPKNKSIEEFWREERYKFFDNFNDKNIVTAHHLDDVIEWWLFSAINGEAKLIPYKRNNIIRPFLVTKKEDFKIWCERNKIEFINDESNLDIKFSRNRIRHNIMPEILKLNPGIHKNLKKLLIKNYKSTT